MMKRGDVVTTVAVAIILMGGVLLIREGTYNNKIRQTSDMAIEGSVVWTASPSGDTAILTGTDSPIEVLTADQKVKKVKTYKNVMSIPSLDIKAYIYDNIDRDSLAYGVGRYPDTAELCSYGNCVVAGHSSSVYNCILNGVEKIGVLEKVLIYDSGGKKHNYYVTGKYVVEPTDVEVLETRDKTIKQFTIITCTDNGTKRLVIETVELDDDEFVKFKRDYFSDRYDTVRNTIESLGEIGLSKFLDMRNKLPDKGYDISSGDDVSSLLWHSLEDTQW